MKVLIVDNNDSFTFNIVDLFRKISSVEIEVRPSQNIIIEEVVEYSHIVFSPGPGLPDDFPIMRKILEKYGSSKAILGICLGHQAICAYYGSNLKNLNNVMHGSVSEIIYKRNSLLFKNLQNVTVGRYHSWIVDNIKSEDIEITATDSEGLIMGVEHKKWKIYGVQFHPESYITKDGKNIFKNFLYALS